MVGNPHRIAYSQLSAQTGSPGVYRERLSLDSVSDSLAEKHYGAYRCEPLIREKGR